MKTAVFLFLLLNLSAAAEAATVRFQTRDGCFIEADYLKPSSGSYVFVNAHGLGSDKNEWGLFQEALSKSGSGYLSLDLRGHGRSVRCGGKSADYRAFSEADWAAASNDITAAAAFLKDRGVPLKEIIFCGASVGSSLALKAALEVKGGHPAAVILLSPGLAYAGIRMDGFLPRAAGFPLLLAASPDDEYSWKSSQYLMSVARAGDLKASFFPGPGGHGVNMLPPENGALIKKILDWVRVLSPVKK